MFQTFESLGDTLPAISRQDGGSLLLYIRLPHTRDFFGQIKDKVNVVQDLQKTFYGATEFSITDNNNYVLTFAEDEAWSQSPGPTTPPGPSTPPGPNPFTRTNPSIRT